MTKHNPPSAGEPPVPLLLTAASVASPSLVPVSNGGGPAYEMKFLLDDTKAAEVEAWARSRLAQDPHGDPALGGAYRTTSLYLDTPQLDVYHRSPTYRRRKFRVRRYATSAATFLERKARWGDRVAKRRTAIPGEELHLLAHPLGLVSWPGHWFHQRVLERRLGPACHITYQRTAFVGSCAEGPLRLTLDRHVSGVPTDTWSVAPRDGGLPLLPGRVILEFKFCAALPTPFKDVAAALRLSPTPISKYRLCREAWLPGLTPRACPDEMRSEVADVG